MSLVETLCFPMSAAELRSNSGRSRLTVQLLCCRSYQSAPGYEANVAIHGERWDGDHEHPITFSVEGLFLSRPEIDRLLTEINGWIDLPLEELAESAFEGDYRFDVPGQIVRLLFGDREDTISAQNAVLTIEIASGRMSTETVFVTDQSCLRLFSEALRRDVDHLST